MTIPEGKFRLSTDELTPRDIKRARTVLGRDPWVVFGADAEDAEDGDQIEDKQSLIAWCLLSREDPDITWDDVLDIPFGTWKQGDTPPPTPEPSANGVKPAKPTAPSSGTKQTGSEPEPSAASTTD